MGFAFETRMFSASSESICHVYLVHICHRQPSLIDSECGGCRECVEADAEGFRIGLAMQSVAKKRRPATAAKAARPGFAAKAPHSRGEGKVRAAPRRLVAFVEQIMMKFVIFSYSMSHKPVVSRGCSPCHAVWHLRVPLHNYHGGLLLVTS